MKKWASSRSIPTRGWAGLRVYAESQYYAWEFEAIKAAILEGKLTYTPIPAQNDKAQVSVEIAACGVLSADTVT
jgi:hypothetical protein